MLRSAKEITLSAVMTALLIGAQYALSFVGGVEIVTALFACFCVTFGIIRGCVVATAFSLIRSIIFGIFPSVIILYLFYYNLFAVVFGLMKRLNLKETFKVAIITGTAVFMTFLFTAFDSFLIAPIFFLGGFNGAIAYFISSMPFCLSQMICALCTVPTLYFPLKKVFGEMRLHIN